MRLVIIGSGNVAYVLGKSFAAAGHEILQVMGRNKTAVTDLATLVSAHACFEVEEIRKDADIYLIALSDSALYEVENWLNLGTSLVAHTAGSVPSHVLQKVSSVYGVLYPLQTLRKGQPSVGEIPFLITGVSPAATQLLSELARSVSKMVEISSDESRAKIHLAATIINNFTNYLHAMAYQYCLKEKLPFSLLIPLIKQTANVSEADDPALRQTGPAARNDQPTIQRHEEMLANYPSIQQIYKVFTDSIIKARRGS